MSIILLTGIGVLFFTNPNDKAHKSFLKKKTIELIDKKVNKELAKDTQKENIQLRFLLQNIGSTWTNKLSDRLIETRIQRVNYYLFSISKIWYEASWYPISIGICNQIFFLPKVEEKLNDLDYTQFYKLFK